MDMPSFDPKKPENIVNEVFDDDRWEKDKFRECFATEILRFAEALAPSFALFESLNQQARTDQASLVAGCIHGVLDDLVVSTKLLVTGKLMASGNVMCQAIEGICIAIMCASDRPMEIHDTTLIHWRCMEARDARVMGHKAVRQVEKNRETLGVKQDAVDRIKKAKEHYDQFSHSGLMGIASRVSLDQVGQIFVGGSFDESKLNAYRVEIRERIGLCGVMPQVTIPRQSRGLSLCEPLKAAKQGR